MTSRMGKPGAAGAVGGASGSLDELAVSLRGWRIRLYVAAFLVDAVTAAYGLTIAAFAEHELSAGPDGLGYLGTTLMGSYAVGCLLLRGWSDRVGSMRILRCGLALLTLGVVPATLIVGRSGSLTGLYFTNAAYGFTLSLYWPPLMRELSLLSPGRTLWRTVGAFNICWAVGMALGNFAGPVLYDTLRITVSLLSINLLFLLAMGTVAMRPPDVRSQRQEAFVAEEDAPTSRMFLLLARVAHFSASFALGGVSWVFIYIGDSLGFSLALIGLILFSREAGRFCSFWVLRVFPGWHYSFRWLAVVQLTGGGALVLSGFSGEWWQLVGLFSLFGFFTGLSYYSSLYYGLNLRSGEGGKSGSHEAILAVGLCLGPLLCGTAAGQLPGWPGGALTLAGGVILAGLVVEAGLWWKETTRNVASSGGAP